MSDLNALLRAIISNPTEDTPRLMYADELEARGQPGDAEYVQYIRVECELAQHKKHSPHMRSSREGWLHQTSSNIWLTHVRPRWGDVEDGVKIVPERGFISAIECTAAQFLQIAPVLLWHESMMEKVEQKCDRCWCGSLEEIDEKGREWLTNNTCPTCNGTAKVMVEQQMPCPDTAHPIRSVTITRLRTTQLVDKVCNWSERMRDWGLTVTTSISGYPESVDAVRLNWQ